MPSDEDEVFWQIALTLVPKIGPVLAAALIKHFGSARAVFRAAKSELAQVTKMNQSAADALTKFHDFRPAEQTLAFTARHDIRVVLLDDPDYPFRLRECTDPPTVLYYKGNAPLNQQRVLSVIGTRTPSDYGKKLTALLLEGLAAYGVLVVSGLADGIDGLAHRGALEYGLYTIAVLGHGLDTIYPADNRLLAKEMLNQGGLVTEFREGTPLVKFNFPRRNRIVAGMSQATVIVETGTRGGSIVTASLASGYDREIFAFPGRTTDTRSSGCLALIRDHAARLITGAEDIAHHFNWDLPGTGHKGRIQTGPLFEEGSPESLIVSLLRQNESGLHLDELILKTGLSSTGLAALLLTLELERALESLPGMRYRLRS